MASGDTHSAAAIRSDCLCSRYAVFGVEGWTHDLGLHRQELVSDSDALELHTGVPIWAPHLSRYYCVGDIGDGYEAALLDTLSTALSWDQLVLIARRAVNGAEQWLTGEHMQVTLRVLLFATNTPLTRTLGHHLSNTILVVVENADIFGNTMIFVTTDSDSGV